MGKSLSKRVFTLNLALFVSPALSTLFRHDTSVQSFISVFAYSRLPLSVLKKRLVHIHGNERYSLRDHVLSVQLH